MTNLLGVNTDQWASLIQFWKTTKIQVQNTYFSCLEYGSKITNEI